MSHRARGAGESPPQPSSLPLTPRATPPQVSALLAAEAGRANVEVIFTSAFESGVAHAHIALCAAALGGPSVAHGLSTYERLVEDALTPPFRELVVGGDLVDVHRCAAALDATADALGARAGTVGTKRGHGEM